MGKKAAVEFRAIRKIPPLLEEFLAETEASGSTKKKTISATVKIGAFQGEKPIGFITAYPLGRPGFRVLSIPGLFVQRRHRGNGIAQQLLRKIRWKARNAGFRGIYINRMLPGTVRVFKKEIIGIEKKEKD